VATWKLSSSLPVLVINTLQLPDRIMYHAVPISPGLDAITLSEDTHVFVVDLQTQHCTQFTQDKVRQVLECLDFTHILEQHF
jgi:hypothetical protein